MTRPIFARGIGTSPAGPPGADGADGTDGVDGLPGVNAIPAKDAVDAYNAALIDDDTSATATRLTASIDQAVTVKTTAPNPFEMTRNTPGNPAPYIIGTDADRLFYAGLQSGGIGYGRYVGPDFGYTGGQPTPTGVTYERCYQIVTFKGYHYLLCLPTAAIGTTYAMAIYRTPVLPLTADSGWNWQLVHTLSTDSNGNGIATQMCVNDDYVFVCSYADPVGGPKVWRSSNGTAWSVMLSDPGIRHHHAIEADPYNPGHVWLTSGDGVAVSVRRSTDNGTTWSTITASAGFQAVQISFHQDYVAFASDNGAMSWQAWMRDTETMVVGSPNWHYNTAIPRGQRSLAGNPYTPSADEHYSLLAFFGAVDPETGIYYACANQADDGDWNGIFTANGPGAPITLLHRGLPRGGNLNTRVYFWRDLVFCGLWHFARLTKA